MTGESVEIIPLERPPNATIRVPGSKSITNRALVLAALSDPDRGSELHGVLRSEDTEIMVEALKALGFRVETRWEDAIICVRRGPHVSPIPAREADLFVGNSGTTMRFLTAMVSLGHGRYRLDGVARMRERPIEDLLAALRQLGVQAASERGDGYPPVVIASDGLTGGRVRLRGDVSSQFLSGLLMAAPLARRETMIEVEGPLVSIPYVSMTIRLMAQFGVKVATDEVGYYVPTWPCYIGRQLFIEPDATAASYFFAAAAITGGAVRVLGFGRDSLQGDIAFVRVLDEMGCGVYHPRYPPPLTERPDRISFARKVVPDEKYAETGILVKGFPLRGITVDMNPISDTVMTLAAVACFAEGPTTIRNVAHIRHKETDRVHALATELRRVGADVEEFADGLTITPRPLHGATVETYNDHRMAMSMALIGLRVPGIVLRNPGCVAKTYPHFFEDLERLRR
jgi:3-phosphoshikimate 1-carboxyvinyltransferase